MDELTRDLNSMIHEQARHDLLGESLTEAKGGGFDELKKGLLDYMKKSGHEVTVSSLAYSFGVSSDKVAGLLKRLVKAGKLKVKGKARSGAIYVLAEETLIESTASELAKTYDEVKRLADEHVKPPYWLELPNVLGFLRRVPGQKYHRSPPKQRGMGDDAPGKGEMEDALSQLKLALRTMKDRAKRQMSEETGFLEGLVESALEPHLVEATPRWDPKKHGKPGEPRYQVTSHNSGTIFATKLYKQDAQGKKEAGNYARRIARRTARLNPDWGWIKIKLLRDIPPRHNPHGISYTEGKLIAHYRFSGDKGWRKVKGTDINGLADMGVGDVVAEGFDECVLGTGSEPIVEMLDNVAADLLSEAMERIRVTDVEVSLEPPDDYDNDFGMDFYVTFEMNERMIAKLLGRQLRVLPKVMKDPKTPRLLQRAIENNNDLLRQIRSAVAHEANAYALDTYDKRAAIDDISWSESWDMTVKLKGDKAVVQGEVSCLGSWR